jgi:hypothetical protein
MLSQRRILRGNWARSRVLQSNEDLPLKKSMTEGVMEEMPPRIPNSGYFQYFTVERKRIWKDWKGTVILFSFVIPILP